MPNKWTFLIKPVRELLDKYQVGNEWCDPFAGFYSPAEIQNDLNPESPAQYHLDAIDFVQLPEIKNRTWKGWLFDPPYSLTQVGRAYQDFGIKGWNKKNPTGAYPQVKDVIGQTTEINGIVISFGWNTVGMGKKRGFEKIDGLCLEHGGNRNNTLVIVERKIGD